MARIAAVAYGLVAYALFLATFLYAVAFLGDAPGFKIIDDPATAGPLLSAAIDVALLVLFGVQHSVMARAWFKRRWRRIVPAVVERSTFVLCATAVLALAIWQWHPIPMIVWNVGAPAGRAALIGLYGAGWAIVLLATFLIDHFELFGLRQVFMRGAASGAAESSFKTPLLYKLVRHPLYLGFLIAFWATPTMTVGHLLFAVVWTAYLFVGARFEERDLVAQFGETYAAYQRDVPMIVPSFGRAKLK